MFCYLSTTTKQDTVIQGNTCQLYYMQLATCYSATCISTHKYIQILSVVLGYKYKYTSWNQNVFKSSTSIMECVLKNT